MTKRTIALSFLLAILFGQDALAQYPFGKNKINYAKRKWKVLQTDNVDIYYYPSERDLATFAAPIVEETYAEFEELFDIKFRNRMPLVFFSSHYDFQQTNIIRSFISEGTGGFTDLIKGRIAIPFTGSLWHFRHVIRHEMVHAFMLEKMAQVMQEHNRFAYTQPPLWFIEGMAEYFAMQGKESTEFNMFIRDGLMHNRLPDLLNIWQIYGSYLMYKEGEAVCHYIADNFGEEAIIQILEDWWVGDTFDMVLQHTIGKSLGQLSDGFMKNLKRRHYPSILSATFAPDIGKQLTEPRSYHARPAVTRGSDGETKLYSNYAHDGVITIAELKRNKSGRIEHRILVESARSARFEWIPASRSKLEARSDTLMFVAKRHERDAIYFIDTRRAKEIEHFTFPELSIISSPTLSPGGDRIVFSAIDGNGRTDLFVCTRATGELVRLTDDPYGEQDPDFHPTENRVLFSSDKCESRDRQHQGIYELDLDTGVATTLTCGTYSDGHPDWAPDGNSFVFSSDRDGTFNIYLYDYDAQLIIRQTNVLGGVTTPVYLPDQSGFVSSGYYRGEFQIFEFPIKNEMTESNTMLAQTNTTSFGWTQREPGRLNYTEQDYHTKLGIDFAGAGIAIDPDFGSVGNGAQLVLSDLLGNVQYSFLFGSSSNVDADFFKRLNVGVTYTNIGSRMNYSLSVFHLISTVGSFSTIITQERRYGVATGLSYPFSKFSRVDFSLVGRFVERLRSFRSPMFEGGSVVIEDTPQSFIGSSFVTYVRDNTLWTIGGPLKGRRWYLTLGHTYDFRDRGFDNSTVQFDLRKYVKLSRRVVLAERFVTRHSWGGDFQIYYLGGPWDFRGYEIREFEGRSTYLLNSEIRFPLIDRFALALPIGNIEFPMFRGSLFFDVARVNRYIFDTDYLGSFGGGVELNLGYAPVFRVNFTRATDFDTISAKFRYELFIGYNY